MKKLSVDWTKHLRDQESKKDFEALVRNSTQVLSRLREMLKERQDNLNRSKDEDFDKPSWAYHQASKVGANKELETIDQWLSFLGARP